MTLENYPFSVLTADLVLSFSNDLNYHVGC